MNFLIAIILSTHYHWMEKELVYSVIHYHGVFILSDKCCTVYILISILKYDCTEMMLLSESHNGTKWYLEEICANLYYSANN